MPNICSFKGINIYFYYNDHGAPHFHAKYADYEMSVSIWHCSVVEGDLPSKQRKLVLEWAEMYQEEIIEDWQLFMTKGEYFTISGLR